MPASPSRELGHDAAAPAPDAPRASPLSAQAGSSTAVLALQRAAGNRAVGAMLARRGTRALARCEGACACGGRCQNDEELLEEGARRPGMAPPARLARTADKPGTAGPSAAGQALAAGALRRAVAARAEGARSTRRLQPSSASGTRAGRLMLQREIVPVPPYRPNPPWSAIGPNNPSPTCTPYLGFGDICPEGALTWRTLFSVIDAPKILGDRCDCSIVRTAYSLFMRAQVPKSQRTFSLADNGNCVSEQLAKSRTHTQLENRVMAQWQAIEKAKVPQILSGGVRDAEIDLIEATDGGKIVPADPNRTLTQKNVDTDITYTENKLAGGLLFGGGSADKRKSDDSEFGPDTRNLSGTIKLRRFDNGSSSTLMSVEATFTFKYDIHDGVDFCPGNTLQKDDFSFDRLQYNEVITDLSRLEASGMARDVGFDVSYHRTSTTTSDIPLTPPTPMP